MNGPDVSELKLAYLAACAMDVQAFKPGNVSLHSAGHGMCADDFLRSAQHSATPITRPGERLGERIYRALAATFDAVRCNTNLGIILLCAPLLQARLDYPRQTLPAAVRQVLGATTQADTEGVFRAIRLASPGGLGRRARHDVRQPALLALTATMRLAGEQDLIARQYANGFSDLFEVLLPHLHEALQRHRQTERALTDLYLFTLSRYPDSHVLRKQGAAAARRVSELAHEHYAAFLRASDAVAVNRGLQQMDALLKHDSINPGTTADLCVATLFTHRLLQTEVSTGETRNNTRTTRLKPVDVPPMAISQ